MSEREMEELKERMTWGLGNLKKCYIGDNTLDKSKLKDELKFSFSMGYVNQAIKNELITNEEVFKYITGEELIAPPIKTEEEEETCSQ